MASVSSRHGRIVTRDGEGERVVLDVGPENDALGEGVGGRGRRGGALQLARRKRALGDVADFDAATLRRAAIADMRAIRIPDAARRVVRYQAVDLVERDGRIGAAGRELLRNILRHVEGRGVAQIADQRRHVRVDTNVDTDRIAALIDVVVEVAVEVAVGIEVAVAVQIAIAVAVLILRRYPSCKCQHRGHEHSRSEPSLDRPHEVPPAHFFWETIASGFYPLDRAFVCQTCEKNRHRCLRIWVPQGNARQGMCLAPPGPGREACRKRGRSRCETLLMSCAVERAHKRVRRIALRPVCKRCGAQA